MKHVGKTGRALLLAAALLLGLLALPVQTQAAKKVSLSRTSLVLRAGESKKLKLKNAPKGKAVKWSSSKKAVAAVSRTGKVTAKKAGEAKVTAAEGKNASDVAALKILNCNDNELASVNVEGCAKLTHFYCSNNELDSVRVSGCPALKSLDVHGMQLTSLDVSGCKALEHLDCNNK